MTSLLQTRRVLPAILALGLFAMGARSLTDPDVWWHLRTGQLIIQNHRVFHTDPYSFTRSGQPWVNHEWLSDVLIFGVYRLAGWGGLIVTFAAIIASTLLLVFLRCPGHRFLAALMTIWGAMASATTWGVRPQMFSLLLASVFLLILERSDEHPNLLWWTVPVMLLWVNLHAGYAMGIVLVALFLIGEVLDVAFGFKEWQRAAPRLRGLVLVLAACFAVVPLNPNGARLYWYPLRTLHSSSMQSYIDEWLSPNFHDPKYLPLLVMLLFIMVALGLSPRRLRPREAVLLLVTMWAALHSVRHIPIFVLVAVPVLSGLVDWLQKRDSTPPLELGKIEPTRRTMLVNAIVLVAFASFALARVRSVVDQQAATENQTFPTAAASFISLERPPSPMLNYDNWGGYFIWKLYPEYRVYADGRADLYGDSFLDDFASSYYLNNHWRDPLRSWQIRTVVLPCDAPLVTGLRSTAGWRQIYTDSQAVVLTLTPVEGR